MTKEVHQYINAPVYGHVAGGDITVVENHQQERELTWWDLSTADLRTCLKAAYSERWGAWRRYWFNTPFFLLGLYCLGLLEWALSMLSGGHAAQLLAAPVAPALSPIWLVMISGVVMLPLAHWLQNIRRVEANVSAHAQADIDGIELVLRRRKNCR